jgi:hypothetical protein
MVLNQIFGTRAAATLVIRPWAFAGRKGFLWMDLKRDYGVKWAFISACVIQDTIWWRMPLGAEFCSHPLSGLYALYILFGAAQSFPNSKNRRPGGRGVRRFCTSRCHVSKVGDSDHSHVMPRSPFSIMLLWRLYPTFYDATKPPYLQIWKDFWQGVSVAARHGYLIATAFCVNFLYPHSLKKRIICLEVLNEKNITTDCCDWREGDG